jgi:hypothetical protein
MSDESTARPVPVDLVNLDESLTRDNNGKDGAVAPVPKSEQVRVNMSGPIGGVINAVRGLGGSAISTPGLARRNMGSAGYLAELVNDVDRASWMLEIRRVGPAVYDGAQLALGTIHRCPPLTYQELAERIQDTFGGGDFRCLVQDDTGVVKHQFPFRIEILSHPPKTVIPGSVNTASVAKPIPLSNAATDEEELTKIRNQERIYSAQAQAESRKRELERMRKQEADERRREQDIEERKAQGPILEAQRIQSDQERKFGEIERKLSDSQHNTNLTMMQMMSTFKDAMTQQASLIKEALTRKEEPREDKTLPLLIELMKSKSSESVEAARIQADSANKFMQMQLELNSKSSAKYDTLVNALVTNKLTAPENSVQQALTLIETGRKQTMDMLEFRENMREPDDLEYDSEGGVLGNLGKLIFGMLRGLLKGGGGTAGLGALLGALNKPDASQVNPADLAKLASMLETRATPEMRQQVTQQQLPLPVQQPNIMRQQVQQQQVQPVQPVQMLRIPVPHVRAPAPQPQVNTATNSAPIEAIFEDEEPVIITQQVEQRQAVIIQQPVNNDSEERLRVYVSEAMKMAVTEDLTDGRREHEWPEYAAAKWNKAFLDSLVYAKDDSARIDLIKSRCDGLIYESLQAQLLDDKKPDNYQNFITALHNLIAEHAQATGIVLTPATAG